MVEKKAIPGEIEWVSGTVDRKSVDVDKRTLLGMASTKIPDMTRDVILPGAWRKSLAGWKRRGSMPKFLAYHLHKLATGHSPVLGPINRLKVVNEKKDPAKDGLLFEPGFAETDLGEEHLGLYASGAMDYFSVGFLTRKATMDPAEIEKILKREGIEAEVPDEVDRVILEAELLEVSAVVVGANLGALVQASLDPEAADHKSALAVIERLKADVGLLVKDGGEWEIPPVRESLSPEDLIERGFDSLEELAAEMEDVLTDSPDLEGIDELVAPWIEDGEEKGVIPFRDYGTAPEGAPWNGPAQIRAADVETLKKISAWFDSGNAENKGAYKLPHHRANDLKAVWRGVSAAMGALLGARGGVDIPSGDRRGVYNHLARHYSQFEKDAPEFREYSPEEIEALAAEGILDAFPDLPNEGEELAVVLKLKDDVGPLFEALSTALKSTADGFETTTEAVDALAGEVRAYNERLDRIEKALFVKGIAPNPAGDPGDDADPTVDADDPEGDDGEGKGGEVLLEILGDLDELRKGISSVTPKKD